MLKSDVIWPASRRFKSGTDWEPVGFFSEALCASTRFDLMLGFFSSSAVSVLAAGFAVFLANGGHMRLVINDILTPADKEAVQAGLNPEAPGAQAFSDAYDLADIAGTRATLSRRDRHFFNCLSWLIANGRIDLRIAVPTRGEGISHPKCGVFADALNRVGFDGSCNFSRTALIENIESVTAFCDWDGGPSAATVAELETDFETTFAGRQSGVRLVDASDIRTRIATAFPAVELAELLKESAEIAREGIESARETTPAIRRALQRASRRVAEAVERLGGRPSHEDVSEKPAFPFPDGPRDYQRDAFEAWRANGQKGLLVMATGTGKTLTALNCLLEIYRAKGYYKALVLVPTVTLVNQWTEECRKFHFDRVVRVFSKNPNWRREIDDLELKESLDPTGVRHSYVVVATYASYAREKVFGRLNVFPRRQVLLIADEAHNMGAGQMLARLEEIPYLRRIGLSATPDRQYDPETNLRLQRFFGAESGFTYEYSMQRAIDNGVLCRYRYFPHLVRLTEREMREYLDLSRKLARYYTCTDDIFRPKNDDILTALLLKRKRIIHKAANKIEAFRAIVRQRFQTPQGLKYTLVYVPEGDRPDEDADVFDTSETIADDADTTSLIDLYTLQVRDLGPTTTVKQFTASSTDRDRLLDDFARGRIDVLASMKCLDEGIDVPRAELAIFCASTGNPRQFVQRRGRILRRHPEKHMAEIHDLVVVPHVSQGEETYVMERNLLKAELRRVYNFASMSENINATLNEFADTLDYYNLSLFDPSVTSFPYPGTPQDQEEDQDQDQDQE